MKYWTLDSGTEFRMEIRMPTQNMHDILGTGIGHWIQYGDENQCIIRHWIWYGDKNAHQEYMKYRALDSGTGFSMEI